MPCRATQDGQVTVEHSDKTWSTGGGNGKPLWYSWCKNPMSSKKRQKDLTLHIDITRWVIRNQIDYILCSWRWRNSIQSAKTRPNRGSGHELLIVRFRLKWKKVGKTPGPFRYGLNQITYDYTVKVINRFKGLDLVDTVLEELLTKVHNIV